MADKPKSTHKKLSLELTHEQHAKIEAIAKLQRRTKKNLCEIALINFIEKHQKQQ